MARQVENGHGCRITRLLKRTAAPSLGSKAVRRTHDAEVPVSLTNMSPALHRAIWIVAALLLLSAGCGPWERVDEFVAGLRCGMSEAEIRAWVSRFPGVQVSRQNFENHAPFVADYENTTVQLWVGDNGLVAAQITWADGRPTSISSKPRIELCGS